MTADDSTSVPQPADLEAQLALEEEDARLRAKEERRRPRAFDLAGAVRRLIERAGPSRVQPRYGKWA